MHEKIYKAFHQDISIDDYKELDELKKRQLLNLVTVFCVVKTYVRHFASWGIKVKK